MNRSRLLVTVLALSLAAGATRAEEPDARVRSRLHLAEEYAAEGRTEEALAIFREVHVAHPENIRAANGRKACLLQLKRWDEAASILEEELAKTPGHPAILEELGTVAAQKGDRAAAERWWRQILATQNGSRGAYSLVAELMTRHRLLDEALRVYADGDSAHPGEFTRQKAGLHELRFEFDAATHEYLKFLEESPTSLSWVEGRLLRIGENENGLEGVIRRVEGRLAQSAPSTPAKPAAPRRVRTSDLVLRKLLADLALEAGRHEDARIQYFHLVDDEPGQLPALLVFGKRCQTDGAFDVAIRVFERVVNGVPDARAVPGALSEIATCQQRLGRWDDALATYARLASEYPETDFALDARFQTGIILRDGRKLPVEAEAAFKELAALRSGPWAEGEPQFQVAECALHQGDLDRARGIYAAIQTRSFPEPTRERALYEEGRALFYQAQFDSANARFKRVAQEFPRGEHVNDALEQSILIHTNPGSPELMSRHAAGALAIRTGRASEAIVDLEKLVVDAKSDPILDETLILLGGARRAARDPEGALASLQQAVDLAQVPDLAAKARLLRGEILGEDLLDGERARKEYEELIVAYPETLAADRARERVAKLTRVVP